ncbi:MAG TPA: metallophosphoesterase [Thermotogota bacterium]|nr:metallophosphoesterase [Thermotogota bacterium]HPJ89513.1 metallophosphoesterase [Thermotogota bacterium]
MAIKKEKRILLLLLFVILSLGIYVFFVEPNILKTTYIGVGEYPSEYPLENEIRIAFFADLHMYKYRGFHTRLLETIESYHPDLILFGGDALAKLTDVKDLERFFYELQSIAPVYTNFGNWEEYAPVHMQQRFEALNIPLIEKETEIVEVKGKRLAITGLESHYFFFETDIVEDSLSYDEAILLIHSPIGLENRMDIVSKYDVVLAGHTHGGQLVIPWLTKAFLDWRNDSEISWYSGRYDVDDTLIYVTRGVGQWLPGRFNCPPELVIMDLLM